MPLVFQIQDPLYTEMSVMTPKCRNYSGADLRQRFPTPRRTMPSYREVFPEELKMLRETMVKTPESTSDGLDTVGNIRQNVLYWAPRVLLLGFIVACVVFYCSMYSM